MPELNKSSSQRTAKFSKDDLASRNPSIDWVERNSFPKRFLNSAERYTLIIEKLISRIVRQELFNPLYHTGTISVLLFFIILGTGIYLTMFFQFGFDASYQAVANIEANFVGRVMRALHRYASGAAVIFVILHGWRTFFQDRFRGPRWMAWTTGIGMAALFWLIGITGYWLIWDERASLLNQTLINLISGSQMGTYLMVRYLVTDSAGSGWIFLIFVITIHLGLSAFVAIFYWFHIKRLSRAKWLPPNYWVIVITTLLIVASILLPVGMLSPIDPNQLPSDIKIDAFFLFYLPGALNQSPLIFWCSIIIVIMFALMIPWLLTRNRYSPVEVDSERCTGCTLCAADCPYNAIEMAERLDNKRHKYIAKIDPNHCVSCGICIGTCTPLAMTLGQKPAESIWEENIVRILSESEKPVKLVFTCERHANQGAHPYLEGDALTGENEDLLIHIIPLTCVGMAHPDLASQALAAGANKVQFIGCPPEDCANREGNIWLQERLNRSRLPKLKSKFENAPIQTDWLPPNEFVKAIKKPNSQIKVTGYKQDIKNIKWLNFLPAITLLGSVFLLQIFLSDIGYKPYPEDASLLDITLDHKAGYPIKEVDTNLEPKPGLIFPTRLVLEVDDQIIIDKTYPPNKVSNTSIAFEQYPLSFGEHHLQLTMFDRPNQAKGLILFDQIASLDSYEVLRLSYTTEPLGGDPTAGERIFNDRSIGSGGSCSLCHSLERDTVLIGPSMAGIATTAENRIPGVSAEDYIRESIMDPDAYIVEGFFPGQMLSDLDERLSPEQIDDLVTYLMTMK